MMVAASAPARTIEHRHITPRSPAVRRSLRARRPLLLEGYAAGWPALRDWTPEALAERLGDRKLPAVVLEDDLPVSDEQGLCYRQLSVADYLEAMRRPDGTPALYLSFRIAEHAPELLAELELPEECASAPWQSHRLWLGPAGTQTPIHTELTRNLLVQLRGEKKVWLYPPWQTAAMYPYPPWSGTPHCSQVHPKRVDLQRHPRFGRVAPMVTTLRPGDALYLPPGWWHTVRALSPSISVSNWWANGPAAALPRAAQLFSKLRRLSV